MGFSRHEYWSGLPCPPPGDLPNPGIEPMSLMAHALSEGFFTTSATAHYITFSWVQVFLAIKWEKIQQFSYPMRLMRGLHPIIHQITLKKYFPINRRERKNFYYLQCQRCFMCIIKFIILRTPWVSWFFWSILWMRKLKFIKIKKLAPIHSTKGLIKPHLIRSVWFKTCVLFITWYSHSFS